MQTSESEMREIKCHHNPIHSIIIKNLLLFGKTGLVKCSPMRKGIHAALVKNISYEDYNSVLPITKKYFKNLSSINLNETRLCAARADGYQQQKRNNKTARYR